MKENHKLSEETWITMHWYKLDHNNSPCKAQQWKVEQILHYIKVTILQKSSFTNEGSTPNIGSSDTIDSQDWFESKGPD